VAPVDALEHRFVSGDILNQKHYRSLAIHGCQDPFGRNAQGGVLTGPRLDHLPGAI